MFGSKDKDNEKLHFAQQAKAKKKKEKQDFSRFSHKSRIIDQYIIRSISPADP